MPVDFFKMDELEKKVEVGFKTFALVFFHAPQKKFCKSHKVFCLSFSLSHIIFHPTKKLGWKKHGTSLWPLAIWQLSHRNWWSLHRWSRWVVAGVHHRNDRRLARLKATGRLFRNSWSRHLKGWYPTLWAVVTDRYMMFKSVWRYSNPNSKSYSTSILDDVGWWWWRW